MSTYSNQFGQQGRFRETLRYEDIIHSQVDACRLAFNEGDPTQIMYVVDALGDLVTPQMADPQFLDALQELDDEWEETKVKMKKEFEVKKRKARGGCPDLVEMPSLRPSVEHFKRKFFIINSLLERKNLGLKQVTTAYD